MRAYDIIMAKREGRELSAKTIKKFIADYTHGEVADYQMSAFAMAVFFRGMNSAELAALVDAMLYSGEVLDLSAIEGIKVDKHSTGGVGDKISLPLAPAVAACGVPVPMIAGRGLGHTGGTIDKLESIPGFNTSISSADFQRQVAAIGACIMGQTTSIAPADKKFYALRDVTATVDCIPLISASIMSKKLAEGIDALVLDVKFGDGAFMKTAAQARELAETMVGIGQRMGKEVVARLTNMNQPLGRMVGNALEVKESIETLKGAGPSDIRALTVELGAEMLVLGQQATDVDSGRSKIENALDDGSAFSVFEKMVEAQGGDVKSLSDLALLPHVESVYTVEASQAGHISGLHAESFGKAALSLGAGRVRSADLVDPAVGLEVLVEVGDPIEKGQPICRVYHRGEKGLEACLQQLNDAVNVSHSPVVKEELFGQRIA